jgi:beta-lactamase regulating signal transducer with metallopeptidase domain
MVFSQCERCLLFNATSPKTVPHNYLIASLNKILSDCNDISAAASLNSLLNIEATLSIIQASLCSVYNITSDCPTTSSRSAIAATISSKPAAVLTSVAASGYSVANTSPLKSAGAIAGVGVACTLAVVFIIALIIFLCFRRRKRRKQDKIQKAETANRQEKAQLHSEDLKPIRKELSGDKPLTSKKEVPIAEMPANEDPQRTTSEMPANEAIGSEL